MQFSGKNGQIVGYNFVILHYGTVSFHWCQQIALAKRYLFCEQCLVGQIDLVEPPLPCQHVCGRLQKIRPYKVTRQLHRYLHMQPNIYPEKQLIIQKQEDEYE